MQPLPQLLVILISCVEIFHSHELIPKILHRTFIYSDSVSKTSEFNVFYKSFAEHNHDFEIKLWFRKDILSLMNDEELTLYNSCQHDIQRADLARYLILYHNGGYYSDLDVYTFDSWSKLVNLYSNISNISSATQHLCVLLEEWHHSDDQLSQWEQSTFRQTYFPIKYRKPSKIQLTNYWMATTAKHPLFKLILDLFKDRVDIPVDINDVQQILWTSGPSMISQAYFDIYKLNKTLNENIHNDVITIARNEWFGTGWCAAAYHLFHFLHLADYCSSCHYLYHLGHGSWKNDSWCQIDPLRCIAHYSIYIVIIIGILVYCKWGPRCCR
eukprot:555236_1